jgi:glutamate carboxypeptidase
MSLFTKDNAMRNRTTLLTAQALPRLILLSTLCCNSNIVTAQNLSPIEKDIVVEVKKASPAALELLERSVNINSGTMNVEGVRKVGDLFSKELASLGFQTKWVDMPSTMNRAGHLIAERKGQNGKRLLLIGHLDTVFEKDSPVQKWVNDGIRVRGQGVGDMKGGDVIIIEALRALHRLHLLENTKIQIVMTGDEESVGSPIDVARKDLIDAAKRSDIALAFEGMVQKDGKDTGTVGRRAAGGFVLKVDAKQAHSAGIFSQESGYGAVFEGARILNAFREQVIEPNLTFNVGLSLAGTEVIMSDDGVSGSASGKNNIIPNTSIWRSDLRYLTAEQREQTQQKMRTIVANSLPGTKSSISFKETYPPMSPTEGNFKLLNLYSLVSQDAGLGEVTAYPPGERGAGDVQFVAPIIDGLDGLGAKGHGAHSPNEDMEIASIEKNTIRAALLLYRLTR